MRTQRPNNEPEETRWQKIYRWWFWIYLTQSAILDTPRGIQWRYDFFNK